jgi:DNA-binding transcriptional LysR family regulator
MAGAKKRFEWDDARVFLAVYRTRTLRDAAAALCVNPSTIRRRIEALESVLAIQLFERTQSGNRPTAAAELLLTHAERLEHAAVGLVSAANALEREPEGMVRLSVAPGVAEHFVAPALPRLFERHPGLRVEVDSSIGYADLMRHEADIAIRTQRPSGGDLIAQKLLVTSDAILGSPEYVRELGPLRSLSQARWITWGEELAHLPSVRWITDRVPAAAVAMRTSCIGSLLSAAERGVGLLLISQDNLAFRRLMAAELSAGLAATLGSMPRLEFWLVSRRSARDVPRVAAVRRFLLEEMARLRRPTAHSVS